MRVKTKSVVLKLLSVFTAVLLLVSCIILFSDVHAKAADNEKGEGSVYKKSDVFIYDDTIERVEDERAFETMTDDNINGEPNADTLVGKSTNGIGVYASTSGASFTYKNEIDFSGLTVEDNLIELFPLYAANWSAISTIRVTFTDTENENNTFSVYYYTFTNGALYARVEYAGKSLALGNESANLGKLMDQYGTWCSGNYLTLPAEKSYPTPLSVCIDYAEKQVYVRHAKKTSLVLDLDDVTQVGKGAICQGFEKDTAYMSVSLGFSQSKQGGVIVKSVLAHNLNGTFQNDDGSINEALFEAPNVQFDMPDSYLTTMPDAAVGIAYPLPKAVARDWFFGTCQEDDISIEVYKKDESGEYQINVSSLITDRNFIPAETGEYQIVYVASNPIKSVEKRLNFKVISQLAPIVIQMTEEYEQPEILTQLYIPELNVYGGSGELTLSETLYYNNIKQELGEARTLFIDKPGAVTLKAVCKGYCGEEVVQYFPLVIPDAIVLSVQNMPKVLQSSTTVTFPDAVCYNTVDNQAKEVEIRVDGTLLSAERTYEVTKTSGNVSVEYSAEGATSKSFTIPVVNGSTIRPSDLMLKKAGNIIAEDSDSGVNLISTQSNSEIYWAYPVVTGYTSNKAFITVSNYTKVVVDGEGEITTNTNMANFDYVDITFANFESETETGFIRIYKDCDAGAQMSYVQINGVGAKYLVDGNLGVENSNIFLYVDTAKGYLHNGVNFSPICEFKGYKAQVSIVGFRFGNVAENTTAGILVNQISNQMLRSDNDWSDINKPVVSFDFELKKEFEVKLGSVIRLPNVKAYDMLSENAEVRVRVYAPDSSNVEISDSGTFVATQTGKYRITYIAEDINGKKGNTNYYCTVYDDEKPVLKINQIVPHNLSLGDTILIPQATATDAIDGECAVYVFMRYKTDYSMEAVSLGGTYRFLRKGVYELTYLTRDSDFNYVEYVMTITVGE